MRSSGEPVRRPSLLIAIWLLSIVVALLTPGAATAVPPPPLNPSDGQIVEAGAQVEAGVVEVGALINRIAEVDQQLRLLDDVVAQRREEVNKALVDLRVAREAADAAAVAVVDTQHALADAAVRVGQARYDFDQFATQAYTRPGSDSMVAYLTAVTPAEMLDRAQLLTLVSAHRQQVLDRLRRAQIDQGNKNSSARHAKAVADAAAATAAARKVEAENAVAAARAQLDQQAAQRDDLLRRRQDAQSRLDQARRNVAGLHEQRSAFHSWDAQRRAEEAAVGAAAAARSSADQAARDRAAELAAGKRPHTQLEEAPPPRRSGPQLSPSRVGGSAAIEIVVDRAMSQLGITYAWGGGDEEGPTLGIRDGGVADRHGDFDKVGFDCSGLMVYAFAGIGVALPHYSGYQYNAGTRVPVGQRERGDMLFWGANGSRHVALYLGGGQMVEAPQSGDVVKVSPVREGGIMPYAVRVFS
ncbi:NlpC/P60 family protein [Nocardia sp. 004]|uniref:NlpC/P60 family protein n=1 Tax=Nocardia sp. 004 TaxID=3385978 RepID=UPI0039A2EF62